MSSISGISGHGQGGMDEHAIINSMMGYLPELHEI